VTWDENLDGFDEVYTQIVVENNDAAPATDFCIFWVDPNQDYNVVVEVDGTEELNERVDADDLFAGDKFSLNGGTEI
jgi:hypothetical protein